MPRTRVQAILDRHGAIVFPGVYDTLSAKLAARAGFPMAFISGYSVSATAIGEPDLGLLTQTEIVERARRVCRSVEIPIIVDADTGYGNPLNVIRTVRELIDAGAAGCFLEDQQWPKKCGHMRGKRVIEREEYLDKIRAAVDTRGDADFFIVARTDALAVAGLDEAIARVTEARVGRGGRQFCRSAELARRDGRDRPPRAGAGRGQHDRERQDAGPAESKARRVGFSPHSLSARRLVRGRARTGGDLRKNSPRRHDARRGKPVDGVRRIQRAHRRRSEVRARRAVRREVGRR